MRTREVIKRIKAEAKKQGATWEFVRAGANHDVYSLNGVMIPIHRHAEMGNLGAEMVWKECAEVLGKDWWK